MVLPVGHNVTDLLCVSIQMSDKCYIHNFNREHTAVNLLVYMSSVVIKVFMKVNSVCRQTDEPMSNTFKCAVMF